MNFLDQIERLNKANTLIRSEKTGTPFEFAQKINCSRSQLYIIIDYLKSHNAPIKYCKKRESFYYIMRRVDIWHTQRLQEKFKTKWQTHSKT